MLGNIFGDEKKQDEGKAVNKPVENPLVGENESNVSKEEIERREKDANALLEEKTTDKLKKEKKEMEKKKKKEGKMRLELTTVQWAALPDPIGKAELLKYSKGQKAANLNASKTATELFDKTKAAVTEVGNQTTNLLATPGQASGEQQPEKKKGILGLGWFGLGGKRRRRKKRKTRRRRKRGKKRTRKKSRRRRK